RPRYPPVLHPFPTRRSSDLRLPPVTLRRGRPAGPNEDQGVGPEQGGAQPQGQLRQQLGKRDHLTPSPSPPGPASRLARTRRSGPDRKSTRLNSSHQTISYAV